jgi:hypothetical protein
MEVTKISEESILKAKQALGLIKAEPEQEIVKGMSKDEIEKMKAEMSECLKKGNEYMKKAEEMKAKIASVTMGPEEGEIVSGKEMPNVGTVVQKFDKAETQELVKAELSEIVKSYDSKFEAMTTLLSSKEQENNDLKKSLDEIKETINALSKANPGPKSITTQNFVDRFAGKQEGELELSISRNKKQVVEALVKAAGNDFNENNMFAKAASTVEIAGALGVDQREAGVVARELRRLHKIVITG